MTDEMPLSQRLLALLDHLGLQRAHFAAQMPGDLADLARDCPERIAGLVLCVPTRLDPAPFAKAAARLLMISDEHGMSFGVTARAVARLPGAERRILGGYDAPGWADVVTDRGEEIGRLMAEHLLETVTRDAGAGTPAGATAREGLYAGISYRIEGTGPALILLPFFLAPSQWDPVVDTLARQFTVIRLGGAHVGGVAALEDRARAPTYQAMFRSLIDFLAPAPGVQLAGVSVAHVTTARILDVGCGSGALDRLLARRLGADNLRASHPIKAVDVNPFLLREAAELARAHGLEGAIRFGVGSAVDLPFAADSFDGAFSVTVLEECDADKAIAEMARVVRPGGRVVVVVRSIDLPQSWSFPVPEAIRARAETPPQSVGAGGVADRSLYARMTKAGLVDLIAFPTLVTLDRPGGPIWRYREDHVLSQLSAGELAEWQRARDKAAAAGLLFQSHALHCAVATKPG